MRISRTAIGLLTLALLAFVATDVMAQRGGGRPGGGGGAGGGRGAGGGAGGGRGGGGFGGGRGGGGDPAMGLLRIEEVREEIELMPDQEEALKKLSESGAQAERPNFDFRNASEEERNEYFEKMRKQREEATAKVRDQLTEVLLPEQMERLDQIALQQRGVGALMDDKIIKVLKITTKQSEDLKNVGDGIRERMMALMQGGDREKMREEGGKIREEIDKEMMAVLTADQKKQFEEMKGKPFELPESARGGFGGGGRGGQGGFGGGRGGGGDRGGRGGGDRGGRGGGDRGGRGGDRGGRPAADE